MQRSPRSAAASRLRPQPAQPSPDPQLRGLMVETAQRLVPRIAEITTTMSDRLARIDGIGTDPQLRSLLESSVEANLGMILQMVTQDLPLGQIRPLPAAVEYAVRLAQRGIPANALVRAYHMGQDDLRDYVYEELEHLETTPELKLRLVQALTDAFYGYIDTVTLALIDLYEVEEQRWRRSSGTAASVMVQDVLAGVEPPDHLQAETGYRLDQHHVALLCWADAGDRTTLGALEAVGRAIATKAGGGPGLFFAIDAVTACTWIPRGRTADPVPADLAARAAHKATGIRIAIGLPVADAPGFRRTHATALATRDLALMMPAPPAVLAYGDPGVAVVSMLGHDLDTLSDWVGDVLGPLATDTENNARLRETLLAFLTARGSHTAAAEELTLHRNTVRYRVERAAELRGRSHEADHHDLETALHCVRFLGARVLRTP